MRRLAPALVLLGALAGCGREPAFPDRTARVTVGGRTTTFTVDACGLDGQTFRLAARSESGAVLQATVGVESDGETGVPRSTGFTLFGWDTVDLAAFGDEAWARRGGEGEAPGEVETARIRGARIQAAGEAAVVDADEVPTGDQVLAVSLDARCDAED
ncbi:MAG TPA: hypothetical protein VFU19_15370 [Iamia sp.]|nr:hypothetical protein [Iamia sp.]